MPPTDPTTVTTLAPGAVSFIHTTNGPAGWLVGLVVALAILAGIGLGVLLAHRRLTVV